MARSALVARQYLLPTPAGFCLPQRVSHGPFWPQWFNLYLLPPRLREIFQTVVFSLYRACVVASPLQHLVTMVEKTSNQQPHRQHRPHRPLKLRRPTTDTENLRENQKSQENQEVFENRDFQVVQESPISAKVPGPPALVPSHVAMKAFGIKEITKFKRNRKNPGNPGNHGYHDVRDTQGKHDDKTQENQDVHASVEKVTLDGAKAVDKSSQEIPLTPLNCVNQENQKDLESHVNSHC